MKILLSIMKDYKKFRIFFFFPVFILFFSCAEEKQEVQQHNLNGDALGTTFNIVYFSEEEIDVSAGIDSIIEVVNQSMSTYRPTSDISKINQGDTTIVVDKHFNQVLKLSKDVNRISRGFFDPTVGNLVNAYGFGSGKQLERIDSATVDSMLNFVGLSKVTVLPEGKIRKLHPEIYLEFNAIAKGYAVDLIAEYFNSKNLDNYLLELGGELVAKGKNLSKQKDWIVAIDDPQQTEAERTFQATLRLKDRAMATSGNYRKYRTDSLTGQKYVHTINPLTGFPEKSNVLSVSILAENCALADAYATACMAMGLHKSKRMLAKMPDVDAYIIYAEENGEEAVFATEGFKAVLVE